ncbi:hypothetical protein Trydic_g23922 [Trypoxylus dichotomus]
MLDTTSDTARGFSRWDWEPVREPDKTQNLRYRKSTREAAYIPAPVCSAVPEFSRDLVVLVENLCFVYLSRPVDELKE